MWSEAQHTEHIHSGQRHFSFTLRWRANQRQVIMYSDTSWGDTGFLEPRFQMRTAEGGFFLGVGGIPPPEISQNWGPRKWDLRRSNSACYNVSVCFNLGRSTEPLLPKPSLIRSRLQFTLKNPKKPGLFVQRVLFSNVRIPVFILSRQNRFPQHTRFTFFCFCFISSKWLGYWLAPH